MKIHAILTTLLLFTSIASGKTNESLTDEELINICLRNAGKRMANDLLRIGKREIRIVEYSLEKEVNSSFILIESLTNEMKNHGGSLFLKNEDGETDKPTLFYRIFRKNVSIEETDRFFGDPVVVRDARVNISYRLVAPETGEILIAKEIEESLENRISKKEYTNLRKGMRKKGFSFASLLEPAIVTAIVGGLMYLFYSRKSSQ